MCRRPWRASAVRNIEKEVKELMHEMTYESLVESSLLWWGIDMVGQMFYGKKRDKFEIVYTDEDGATRS